MYPQQGSSIDALIRFWQEPVAGTFFREKRIWIVCAHGARGSRHVSGDGLTAVAYGNTVVFRP